MPFGLMLYALKRLKLGLPHKPEAALTPLPVCTDSLGHYGPMSFYDFGSYDQPFPRYSARLTVPELWQPYRKIMATLPPLDRPTPTYGGRYNDFYSYLQPFGRARKKSSVVPRHRFLPHTHSKSLLAE